MSSIAYSKSYQFSISIIETYRTLINEKREFVLSRQLVRAGTSIGANVKEAVQAQSKKDFLSKINIALKEAEETEYWLELLRDTKYLSECDANKSLYKCRELIKILISTVKTTKINIQCNS